MTIHLLIGVLCFGAAVLLLALNVTEYRSARVCFEEVEVPIRHSWIHLPGLCFAGAAMCFAAKPEDLLFFLPGIFGIGFLLHSILLNLELLLDRSR